MSTDCSIRGERLCDTSQPGGYCTIFNCSGNSCPDDATCVAFESSIPGCGFNDRVPSRVGRSFCMKYCTSNDDCRAGYVCANPRQSPWNASILDNDPSQKVCIVPPLDGVIGGADSSVSEAPVCKPAAPPVDPIDAGVTGQDAGSDASSGTADADASDVADAGASD